MAKKHCEICAEKDKRIKAILKASKFLWKVIIVESIIILLLALYGGGAFDKAMELLNIIK